MVNRGDVFYSPNYVLHDGELHDTWFIVLCEPTPWTTMICLKSTSKGERYGIVNKGCNAKKWYGCFHIPTSWQSCFTENSYVSLTVFYEIGLAKYWDMCRNHLLKRKGAIDQECWKELLDCLGKFREDIPDNIWDRIFLD